MDEDSRLSSPTPPSPSTSSSPLLIIEQQQQEPSTSAPSSSDPSPSSVSPSKDEEKKPEQETAAQQQQPQPSTSKTCKDETREFGYSDALPFAPWRRKRYGLTVQGLHEEIVDMYHWIKPNEIESRLRTKVYENVRDSILRRWAHKKVKISMFGSLRTNLFLPTSDIDVLVECDDWVGSNPNDEDQEDWLSETARQLEDDRIAESVMIYGGAFVPIVKMVDRDTRLSIDISFNTVQGVRAASYIGKVKEEFPLIEPLVLLLKQFLHYRNLNQTFTGGLSSYGLVLLLVNFFQLYALNMRHRTIYDRGVNLGHLLLRFLELYSLEFNFEEVGISPGQACYIPKSAVGARYGLKRAQQGNLALEDPLLTANDVGRSTYNFSSIANAFGQALQILMVAVTLRERKGRNQLATKVYKGSLLHLIMPFTSKELTYRNWLMSGVLSFPRKDGSASYDLNRLHNTLVSPTVDLSRYGWLRKVPLAPQRQDSRDCKVPTAPAEDIKNQVLQQLKEKLEEEAKKATAPLTALESESSTSSATSTICAAVTSTSNASDLTMTAPPIAVNTASVNTSATVSTAASVSEREDTDSPGLSSSLGTPSSEDDDDGVVNRKSGAVQFKKPFSEVVAQTKRTQTNFDDAQKHSWNLGHQGSHKQHLQLQNHLHSHQSLQNHYPMYPHPTPAYAYPAGYLDYATAAAGYSMNPNLKTQRSYVGHHQPRNHRNPSQRSEGSEGYQRNRWPGQQHLRSYPSQNAHVSALMLAGKVPPPQQQQPSQTIRGRPRGPRAASNSSNRSGHSTDSRGSGSRRGSRSGRAGRAATTVSSWPSIVSTTVAAPQTIPDADATLTEDSGEKNATLTDGCREDAKEVSQEAPRMYADAVKKKSSVGSQGAWAKPAEASTSNKAPSSDSPQSTSLERSYCSAIKTNLYPKSAASRIAPVSREAVVLEVLRERESPKDQTKSSAPSISESLRQSGHLGHGIFSN